VGCDRCVTFANKALDVEVIILHAEHLAFAGLATVLTRDGTALPLYLLLLQGTVDSLLVKRCGNTMRKPVLVQYPHIKH